MSFPYTPITLKWQGDLGLSNYSVIDWPLGKEHLFPVSHFNPVFH